MKKNLSIPTNQTKSKIQEYTMLKQLEDVKFIDWIGQC